jgi:hypothetical protein
MGTDMAKLIVALRNLANAPKKLEKRMETASLKVVFWITEENQERNETGFEVLVRRGYLLTITRTFSLCHHFSFL